MLLPMIYFYIFCKLLDTVDSSSLQKSFDYKQYYGDGYGTEWIYFPDGDGVLHYVNLTSTADDLLGLRNSYNEMEFRLYIRNDTESYILLDEWGKPIDERNMNIISDVMLAKVPLKIITHGWKSSADKVGVSIIKNAYIETQHVNVITVDWSGTADSILYHWVANETKAIGARIASFLIALHNRYKVGGENIHLIGHSLGAHVMGIAASKTNITINRVTGLDPARPLFEYPPQDDSGKLDPSDAEYVDVIHTCGGLLGVEGALGTADFYPNKGIPPQPGCDNILKIFEACSHGRSFEYFAESIKYPTSFPAYQCVSWEDYLKRQCDKLGYMGENVNRNMSGKFYLHTNAFEPFGLHLL